MTDDSASSSSSANKPCSAGRLFAILWDALIDVLGSAATAALIQRAIKRAAVHRSEVGLPRIRREGFDYCHAVPDAWQNIGPDGLADLRLLARELSPLLRELTGPVVVRRLNRIAELKSYAILFAEDEEQGS